jgi:hypothetical protein
MAENTEKILIQVDVQATEAVKSLAGLTKKVEDLKDEQKKLDKTTEEGRIEFERYNSEIRKTQTETKKLQKEVDGVEKKEASLRQELRSIVVEMQKLHATGGENTKQFRELSIRAGALRDSIDAVNDQIKTLAVGSRLEASLKTMKGGIEGVVASAQIAEGTMQAFGSENEDVSRGIQKLVALQSINNGVQTLFNSLKKEGALVTAIYSGATKAAAIAQSIYTAAVGTSTGALKAFRVALLATGIGAIIAGIVLLVQNWDDLTSVFSASSRELKKVNEEVSRYNRQGDETIKINEKQIELLEARGAKQSEIMRSEAVGLAKLFNIRVKELNALNKKVELDKETEEDVQRIKELEIELGDIRHKITILNIKGKQQVKKEREEAIESSKKEREENKKAAEEKNKQDEADKKAAYEKEKAEQEAIEESIKNLEKARKEINQLSESETQRNVRVTKEKYAQLWKDLVEANRNAEEDKQLTAEEMALLRVQLEDQTASEINGIWEKYYENQDAQAQAAAAKDAERAANKIKGVTDYATKGVEALTAFNDFSNALDAQEIQNAEVRSNAELEKLNTLLENKMISEEVYTARKSKLEKKLEKDKAKIARDGAKREKVISIFQATIATANGIANALTVQPAFMVPIFTALAAATGAAQIAAIAATPLPKASRGAMLQGASHAQGGIHIEAEGGEAIINKRSTSMFKPLLSKINEAGGGVKFANGGITDGGFSLRSSMSSTSLASDIRMALQDLKIYTAVTDINKGQGKFVKIQEAGRI